LAKFYIIRHAFLEVVRFDSSTL